MGIYNSINEAFERKYGLADVKPLKKINEAKEKQNSKSIKQVFLDNKKSIWSAMGDSWETARDLVLEILDRDELKSNPKVAEAKEVFKKVKSESKFASLVTTYMTGMSIIKNESLNKDSHGVKRAYLGPDSIWTEEKSLNEAEELIMQNGEWVPLSQYTGDYIYISANKKIPTEEYKKMVANKKSSKSEYEDIGWSFIVYKIDEDGDEIESLKSFKNKTAAINYAKKQSVPTHVVFVPKIDPDDDPDYAEYLEIFAPYEAYEEVWSSLNESCNKVSTPRLKKFKESKEKDLWDTIYGELTEDGSQYIVTDKKGRKTPRINKGAGYDYRDQISVDRAGNIVVKGKEERDFKAAIDIADKYAKKGVKYNIAKSDYGKGYTYGMTIEIPYKDKVDENYNKALNEDLSEDDKLFIYQWNWGRPEYSIEDFKNKFTKEELARAIKNYENNRTAPDLSEKNTYFEPVKKPKMPWEESLKEAKKNPYKNALGKDVEEYQDWVDYDMKRYHKISDITKKELDKAGLEVIKDEYGDYEVIAKDKKALGEAKKLKERYYYINNNLSEKKAFWQSMRDAGATEKQLIAAQKGDEVKLADSTYHILDKALPGTEFRENLEDVKNTYRVYAWYGKNHFTEDDIKAASFEDAYKIFRRDINKTRPVFKIKNLDTGEIVKSKTETGSISY